MKTAYYARPISLYGSKQEARDEATIRALGYEPVQIKKPELQARAKAEGMAIFEVIVKESSALFFRAFLDGSIGAGVAKEIAWAAEANLPVAELPSQILRRTLSIDATRANLLELGTR